MKHDSDDRLAQKSARTQNIRAKAERGEVLNLSELALISGYGRSSLQGMRLPLICRKISLSDFRRVLRRRQDALDMALDIPRARILTEVSKSAEEIRPMMQTIVDKFRAPRLKRA
jgi:hypothetical protein